MWLSPCFHGAVRADAIRHVDLKARAHFTYKPDPRGVDTWRSHAFEALAGTPWQGDCDDLSSTVLDLFSREGVALDALFRVVVSITGGTVADHMIACVWDDDEVCWIVGDTFGEAYPAKDCPHRPLNYQRMDDIVSWRDGAPWLC